MIQEWDPKKPKKIEKFQQNFSSSITPSQPINISVHPYTLEILNNCVQYTFKSHRESDTFSEKLILDILSQSASYTWF